MHGTVATTKAGAPPRPALLDRLAEQHLIWLPEIGIGYYPVADGIAPYDADYFARYAVQADSDMGRALMAARVEFVAGHYADELVDIGIGSGAFIAARKAPTLGYDVNPAAVEWLKARELFVDPYAEPVEAVSLWDVLEHIPDFVALLSNVRRFVFVSLPIFHNAAHVLRSKHFRKDEHCWYFTAHGLVRVMRDHGFRCLAFDDRETRIGREDILSFAFARDRDPSSSAVRDGSRE